MALQIAIDFSEFLCRVFPFSSSSSSHRPRQQLHIHVLRFVLLVFRLSAATKHFSFLNVVKDENQQQSGCKRFRCELICFVRRACLSSHDRKQKQNPPSTDRKFLFQTFAGRDPKLKESENSIGRNLSPKQKPKRGSWSFWWWLKPADEDCLSFVNARLNARSDAKCGTRRNFVAEIGWVELKI